MKIALFGLLTLASVCNGAAAQTQTEPVLTSKRYAIESQLGQIEEIAMCHHAIKAARHDGISLEQNPYYRYVINAPRNGRQGIYPIPERCENLATSWVLSYTKMSKDEKNAVDKMFAAEVGMLLADLASDAEFFTVVITKMDLEGPDALMWENRDRDTPITDGKN